MALRFGCEIEILPAFTPGWRNACWPPALPVPSRATSCPNQNVSGVPLCHVLMAVSVHPPRTLFAIWLLNLNGSSHNHEITTACRRSQSDRPRSDLMLNGFETVAPRLSVELLSMDFASVYDPVML